MNADGNGHQFHVHISGEIGEQIEIFTTKRNYGAKRIFLSFSERTHRNRQAVEAGPSDVWRTHLPLPTLELQMRQAAVYPVVVDYGVHTRLPHVFVRGFKLLS